MRLHLPPPPSTISPPPLRRTVWIHARDRDVRIRQDGDSQSLSELGTILDETDGVVDFSSDEDSDEEEKDEEEKEAKRVGQETEARMKRESIARRRFVEDGDGWERGRRISLTCRRVLKVRKGIKLG